jgi:hypothetical protein
VRIDDSDLVELMARCNAADGRAYEDLLQAIAEFERAQNVRLQLAARPDTEPRRRASLITR